MSFNVTKRILTLFERPRRQTLTSILPGVQGAPVTSLSCPVSLHRAQSRASETPRDMRRMIQSSRPSASAHWTSARRRRALSWPSQHHSAGVHFTNAWPWEGWRILRLARPLSE